MSKGRIVLSVILFLVWSGFMAIWSRMLPQLQGISAANALNNDSVVDNAVSLAFRSGDPLGWIAFVILIALLALIWWPLLRKAMFTTTSTMAIVLITAVIAAVGFSACTPNRAVNSSESNQSADIVEIQPNQTAFVIPAVGGNLAEQAQFDSIDYLVSKKVASKRVVLEKTYVGARYVTNNIVILVTRTPVARQWTKSTGTGTGEKNQSLCGESIESIEVCFQIAASAEIQERDAAVYLYHYPTTKVQNNQLGSVYTATELEAVVDNQVHNYLVAYLAEQTGRMTLDEIIAGKVSIVDQGAVQTKAYFGGRGITIDHLGMGGELVLPPDVQDVRNRLYISQKEREISQNLGEAYDKLQGQRGTTDAANLAKMYNSLGGNASSVGAALEGYRWNGSRVTVQLGSDSNVGVTPDGSVIPQVRTGPTR